MQHDTNFSVRYLTDDLVPIHDIIESLNGIETVLGEVGRLLPHMVTGLTVDRVEVRVRQIAQESPLRELFLVSLFLGFQKELETEVIGLLEQATGYDIPANMDTIVTVLALIVVFYGAGAIKDLVVGPATDGPARRQLAGLIAELSGDTGKSEDAIRSTLERRYGEPTMKKRIANAASRFFTPSKRKDSAPVEVNGRTIDHETVSDVPAQYLIEHESEVKPSRNFDNVTLELHAQDRDHAGQGWAAIPVGLAEKRIRLKLQDDVATADLWNRNTVKGDITMVYERVGLELVPKEIHLHRLTGGA
jgi:hypothetical protein